MLWNIIYDFFVQYIFGGVTSTEEYFSGYLGQFCTYVDAPNYDSGFSDNVIVKVPFIVEDYVNGGTSYLYLGNYLSFIATLISIVAIVLICCALIKKIYNMCAHIIG